MGEVDVIEIDELGAAVRAVPKLAIVGKVTDTGLVL
jgi:hypothetical protein